MPGVKFAAWTYNGRIPGPTLRAREGERLRITFANGSQHPHTIHFHGIHPAEQDGVPGLGRGPDRARRLDRLRVRRAARRAAPLPLPRPAAGRAHRQGPLRRVHHRPGRTAREEADELVMVMNGFDTNFDRANEVYAANTIGFAYMDRPITVRVGELVRVYLVNVLEYDLINSFHLHGNLFDYFPTGTVEDAARADRHGDALPGPARDPRVALRLSRQVHVPRPPVRVHRARLAGLLRGRVMGTATRALRVPVWLLGLVPLLLIVGGLALFVVLDAPGLGERRGPPAEELAVERTVLSPGVIELTVRNDGPTRSRSRRSSSTTRSRSSPAPTTRSAGWRRATVRVHAAVGRGRGLRGRAGHLRPAGRSCTRSRSRSRRRRPTSASSG